MLLHLYLFVPSGVGIIGSKTDITDTVMRAILQNNSSSGKGEAAIWGTSGKRFTQIIFSFCRKIFASAFAFADIFQ
jgi:hypothetical protein